MLAGCLGLGILTLPRYVANHRALAFLLLFCSLLMPFLVMTSSQPPHGSPSTLYPDHSVETLGCILMEGPLVGWVYRRTRA